MNLPQRTAFAAFHILCMVVFSLSFVSRYFLISSLISLLTHWFFSSILFSLHVIIFFSFLFLWLISSLMPLWAEKMPEIISVLLNLGGLFCTLVCGPSQRTFHVHLKRMCILFGFNVLKISIKSNCCIIQDLCCLIDFLSRRSLH